MELLKKTNLIAAYPLIALLWVYQHTLSPDHGWFKVAHPYGFCKFYPTCSVYAISVLKQNGIVGLPKIFRRVVSCNPFSAGGIDLPHPTFKS